MSDAPWEVLATCPSCRVEGAAIETMDPLHPSSHFATPLERRCRVCARVDRCDDGVVTHRVQGSCPHCAQSLSPAAQQGEGACDGCGLLPVLTQRVAPCDLSTPQAATEALTRFATHEGAPDVAGFCEANLGGTLEETVAKLVTQQPVQSSLDVLAFLFPGTQGGGTASPDAPRLLAPVAAPPAPPPAAKPVPDPLQQAKVLASVAVADGELRADERAFAEAMLRREGWPELPEDGWRVYRPWETGPAPSAEAAVVLIEAAIQLSHLDHERDASEWKVILAYATAWNVPEPLLTELDQRWVRRHTTVFTQLITWLNTQVRLH